MTAFVEIGKTLVNVDLIEKVWRTPGGCEVRLIGEDDSRFTETSFVDIVMALESVGCRTWLASYGDGKKEPRPGEMEERKWRAGEDGLRPTESARDELQ